MYCFCTKGQSFSSAVQFWQTLNQFLSRSTNTSLPPQGSSLSSGPKLASEEGGEGRGGQKVEVEPNVLVIWIAHSIERILTELVELRADSSAER